MNVNIPLKHFILINFHELVIILLSITIHFEIYNFFFVDDSSESTQDIAADLLREADILIASIGELRRESQQAESTVNAVHSTPQENDNAAVAPVVLNDIATTVSPLSASRVSAGTSNDDLDESVVLVGDVPQSGSIKPIGPNEDADVIFVTEVRQPYRTLATIDLCDSFDSQETTTKASAAQPSSMTTAKTATDNNNESPKKSAPGTTKCPICLDMFTLDQILSTMCGHLYCEPCIQNVIKTRKKCPMCNRGLKQNQVHRLFLDASL